MTTQTVKAPKTLPSDVKQSVTAYLLARTYAEIMREKVNELCQEILDNHTFIGQEHPRAGGKVYRVTDPTRTYPMRDIDFLKYLALCDEAERQAGLKPPEMEREYCPALVAESMQRDAEICVIESCLKMIGQDPSLGDRLYLEKRQKFIDLSVSMVLSHPDYEAPSI